MLGKLQNEEFQNCAAHKVLLRLVASRRMRWTVHVAGVGDEKKGC